MTTTNNRLANVQARISNLESFLSAPENLTNVSAGGVSETFDREAMQKELDYLYRLESRLLGTDNGLSSSIDMRRC